MSVAVASSVVGMAVTTPKAPVIDPTTLSDGRSAEAVADLALAALNKALCTESTLTDPKNKKMFAFKGDLDRDPRIEALAKAHKFKLKTVKNKAEWDLMVLKSTLSSIESSPEGSKAISDIKKIPKNSAEDLDLLFVRFFFEEKLCTPDAEHKKLNSMLFEVAPKVYPKMKEITKDGIKIRPTYLLGVLATIFMTMSKRK